MNIIERLYNCPNCGGTLQDDGACRFCGSKVYDFLQVNMKDYKPIYIRMKLNGQIVIMPVRFDTVALRTTNEQPYVMMEPVIPTGTLDFTVVGDTIVEDTKITGSEY